MWPRSIWQIKVDNELKNILYDDQDHLSFSKTNGEMSEKLEMGIFKYVLM